MKWGSGTAKSTSQVAFQKPQLFAQLGFFFLSFPYIPEPELIVQHVRLQ
ncbi:hypothetical protein XBO1_2480012 [Xenorhabdus bovienii str. oregonense]|uniref:Uncharacterized protein n=1 Tax=Xenorhabdus bovienii str. oregonense TaxID=1398202 RepID=A0A077P6S2_XENBV|nr:hypothetical protein XBO1_2480012 [Xenorhabdus bovienii str. oregonense]